MADPAKKFQPHKGPKWEKEVYERIKAGIKKYQKPLADMVSRDANEGDTRLLITDFLCEVLGYDKFRDLTTEYEVRGEFADYGIRIDKDLAAFIEVKRATTKLGPKHLRQVEMYAVNEGVEWVLLTNGREWQAYHLRAGLPIEIDLTLIVDLLSDEPIPHKAALLFYLSLESLKRRQINELWQARRATSEKSLARVITSKKVIGEIRRELRRQTGQNVENGEVERLLRETVIKAECLD